MGNCWRRILHCFCCFVATKEEERPLLQDVDDRQIDPRASNARNIPHIIAVHGSGTGLTVHKEVDGPIDSSEYKSLLAEHDQKYTIYGEKKKSEFTRARSQRVPTPVGSPRKLKRLTSDPCIVEEEDDPGHEAHDEIDSITTPAPTKRQLTAMELLQTETTYIRNLKIILEIYKLPLENAVRDGEPILAAEDIRNIFGGISDILKVHTEIHQELSEVIQDWEEDCEIAGIITKYQSQLTKVYPPYVNYFDMGKDVIMKQQKANTAFSEFLTNCFNNPTCLKQPLDALLIRPVQRLPSMSLLISDLQRRTPEELPDHTALNGAKDSLKQVLSHINEDKRKTEGKMKIFDIIYEVEKCPVEIVSSTRLFVTRINVTTLNEGLYRTGERLGLYLLTDMIEVSKFKRSPGRNSPLLKHIRMLQLSDIEEVIDINDSEESQNMFGIKLREASVDDKAVTNGGSHIITEKLCICQSLEDRPFMEDYLRKLVKQISVSKKEKTKDNLFKKMDPSEVQPMLRKGSKIFRRSRVKTKRD